MPRGFGGTYGHLVGVAHIAEVTIVDHFFVVLGRNLVDFHALGVVYQVEKVRERVAKVKALTTAVADIEHTLHLFVECLLVVVVWI